MDWSTYHAVAGVLGVCVQNTVGGGVVTSCVHGIGASLVEGGLLLLEMRDLRVGGMTYWEPHVPRGEASDLDHGES